MAASAIVVAVFVLVANVTSASRVTQNAEQLHWANATLGNAALARAAAGQAALFSDLDGRGLAAPGALAAAMREREQTTEALRALARDAPPRLGPELTSLLLALRAEPIDAELIESEFASLAPLLRGEIADLEARVARSDRSTDLIAAALRLLVMLIIPVAAIVAYRSRARSQLRAAEIRLDAEIEAERELSRAKDRFIAGMSHEMRTPLTGITGFAEVMLDESSDAPVDREYLGVIYAEAAELSRMVDDFIATSKLDSNGLAIEEGPVDLHELVTKLAKPFQRRGVEIEIPIGDATAVCDRGRTSQIVLNLLANAHQHGGDRITVEVSCADTMARVEVRDNGRGVPPDVEPLLFTRFVNEPTALTAGSLGLGTWVARELARAMGGDVTYHRDEGITRFCLDLPPAEVLETADSDQSRVSAR